MRIDKMDNRDKYKKTLRLMYSLILCFFMLIFILLIEMVWNNGDNGEFMALCISMVLIFYAGILLNRTLRTEQREIDKLGIDSELEQLDNQEGWREIYNQISDSKKKISYMRHDMANHLQVINSMYDKLGMEYPAETLGQIVRELSRTRAVKYCDNMLLDLTFEQRIKSLIARGVNVDADIQLIGIEHAECEQLCFVFGMLIDYIAVNLESGQAIFIKIQKHGDTGAGMVVKWHLMAESELDKNVDTNMLLFLIKRMNGSMLVEKTGESTTITGMMEVIW